MSLEMISFTLFPQATPPSMNFNISQLVFSRNRIFQPPEKSFDHARHFKSGVPPPREMNPPQISLLSRTSILKGGSIKNMRTVCSYQVCSIYESFFDVCGQLFECLV